MQLRNTITQPIRLGEEEYFTGTVHSSTNQSTRISKDTLVAYPALLASKTADLRGPLLPAAFPSKKLVPPCRSDFKNSVFEQRHSQHAEALFFGKRQEIQARVLPVGRSEGKTVQLTEQGLLHPISQAPDEVLHSHDLARDIQTTTLYTSPTSVEASIQWKTLDEGLQLYIFDNLFSQISNFAAVADVLLLDAREIANLAYLRNLRQTHPATVEQLWNYCSNLGNGGGWFVPPEVLNQYMEYFTFASKFESASVEQRRLAVRYLRQRRIEGSFVDALLPAASCPWSVEVNMTSVGEDIEDAGMNLNMPYLTSSTKDMCRLDRTIGDLEVHHSHDLAKAADHFKSCYLMQNERKNLLAAALPGMSAFQQWLVYGTTTQKLDVEGSLVDRPNLHNQYSAQDFKHPVLQCLKLMVLKNSHILEPTHLSTRQKQIPCLWLYAISRSLAETHTILKRVDDLPLSEEEKFRIQDTAEIQSKANIIHDLRHILPQHHLSWISGSATSSESAQSTTLLEDEALLQYDDYDDAEKLNRWAAEGISVALSHEAGTTQLPYKPGMIGSHHPAPGARPQDKERSDTISTNATVPTQFEYLQSDMSLEGSTRFGEDDGVNWQYRDRTSSAGSFHTARDEAVDVEMITPKQNVRPGGRKSPTAPPYSPITDHDEELRPPSSIFVQTESVAELLQVRLSDSAQYTPWISNESGHIEASLNQQQIGNVISRSSLPLGQGFSMVYPHKVQSTDQNLTVASSYGFGLGQEQQSHGSSTVLASGDSSRSCDKSRGTYIQIVSNHIPATTELGTPPNNILSSQSITAGSVSSAFPAKSLVPQPIEPKEVPQNNSKVLAGSTQANIEAQTKRRTKQSRPRPQPIPPIPLGDLALKPQSPLDRFRPSRKAPGNKRGPYMTKKRRADAGVAAAAEEVDSGKHLSTALQSVQRGRSPLKETIPVS